MRVARVLVGPAFRARLRVTVEGAGQVPGSGGVLLAANHRSFLDHFLIASAAPRATRFLGKVELADGLAGRFNVAMGMVPVERGTADLSALATIADLLRAGACVGVFPEGTRSPDGTLFRFRSGLSRLAADAGVPTVPTGLVGTAEVWPRRGRPRLARPPRGLLGVRFGPPVAPPRDNPRARRAHTAEVHAAVAARCGQPLTDAYAPIPAASRKGAGSGRRSRCDA